MSAIEKAAESVENPQRVGRIMSLNMQSEEGGLNYDSIIRDTKTIGDSALECSVWA